MMMFGRGKRALAAVASVVLLAGCARTSTNEATAQALDNILAGPHRPEADHDRDRYRHPKDTLLFFGIRPEMTVLEVWPEPGWYTDIIAPLVRDRGKYYAAVIEPDPTSQHITARLEAYRRKLASNPTLYGNPTVVTFPSNGADVAPPGTVDLVVTFCDLHDWMAAGTSGPMLATIFKALKPGGVLGIVDHRGPAYPGRAPAMHGGPDQSSSDGSQTAEPVTQDPRAKSGYVNEQYAIDLIRSQGFKLVGSSEVNANPKDTKDYEQGVWTLPPTYRLGDMDRDKYTEIGESDRFTLKFEKPTR